MKYKRVSTFSHTPNGFVCFNKLGQDARALDAAQANPRQMARVYTPNLQGGAEMPQGINQLVVNQSLGNLREATDDLDRINAKQSLTAMARESSDTPYNMSRRLAESNNIDLDDARTAAKQQQKARRAAQLADPNYKPLITRGASPIPKRTRFLNKRNLAIGGGALGLGALGAGAYALSRRGNQEEAKYSRGVGRRADFAFQKELLPSVVKGVGTLAGAGAVLGAGSAGLKNVFKSRNWTPEEKAIMQKGTPEEKAAMAAKLNSEGRRASYRSGALGGAVGVGGLGLAGAASALTNKSSADTFKQFM